MTIHVVLLGFGTVGQGVYQTIRTHQRELKELLGQEVRVEGILVKNDKKPRSISSGVVVTTDYNALLNLPKVDVIVEAIVGREPAFTYVKGALNKGIPVISANKEMVAHKGKQLKKIASYNSVDFSYEAAVAGGIPVIGVIKELLHVNRIYKIEGILNGTSNYILTIMRVKNYSFEKALQLAQDKGFAEADPSNDILGTDAFYKLMILSDLVFGTQPDWETVMLKGIDQLTLDDINVAKDKGQRIKLIATVEKDDNNHLTASVQPIYTSSEHPLYGIEGVDNAVNIKTDLLNDLLLKGPGAGALPTASAIIQDVTLVAMNDNTPQKLSKLTLSGY